MDQLFQMPWLFTATAMILSYALYHYFSPNPTQGLEAHLPVVGLQGRLFPWAMATLASFSKTREWALAGYETVTNASLPLVPPFLTFKILTKPQQHSRHNQPYILPSLDRGSVVIVPPAQTKALYGESEDILDAHATQNQTIQTKWTIADQEVANNSALHINVIRRQMTRSLDHLVPVLASEIRHALEQSWGTNSEWKTVAVWDLCLEIVAAAGNAAFCGTELCRWLLPFSRS
jgi:hypothetical protein